MDKIIDLRENYLDDAFKDVESITKFATLLATGGNLPDHCYIDPTENDKDQVKKPNIGMILLIISWGEKLNIPFTQALQQIVPINGKMTIMGDLSRALIYSRGDVVSWKEESTGSINDGDFKYSFTVKRDEQTLTRSYTLAEAKQRRLYPSPAMLNGPNKAKHLQSPWYNYSERMCMYRALGFIARDLFPDVMGGLILQEEVWDYPDMRKIFIEGKDIELTNSTGKEMRSESITQHAVEEIDKKLNSDPLQNKKGVKSVDKPTPPDRIYSEKELSHLKTPQLVKIAADMEIIDQITVSGTRNTQKRVTESILAFQEGGRQGLTDYLLGIPTKKIKEEIPVVGPNDDLTSDMSNVIPDNRAEKTKEFGNAWGVDLPDLPDTGEREFPVMSDFYKVMTKNGVDDVNYIEFARRIPAPKLEEDAKDRGMIFHQYRDKEVFCTNASIVDINVFINGI